MEQDHLVMEREQDVEKEHVMRAVAFLNQVRLKDKDGACEGAVEVRAAAAAVMPDG